MSAYPLQFRLGLPIIAGLLVVVLAAAAADCSQASRAPAATESEQPQPLSLEDPPQPLIPVQPRTEADEDRLDAVSLFAAARTLEQKGEYAQALRLFQRALRYDPDALTIVLEIIPLALHLERDAEALRYMRKALELESPDPTQILWLEAYLLASQDVTGVLGLYERALAAQEGTPQTADDVQLRLAAGRLYHALDEHDKAADCFAQVIHALDNPEQYGLDQQARDRLLRNPGLTYLLFGESFLEADRLDEAESAFAKAHQVEPDQALLEFNHARILARRGQSEKALAALEAAFREKLAGEGTAPFDLLAEVLDDLGRKEELIERLEGLHVDTPEDLPLAYILAEQYHDAGLLDKAEPLYRELIQEIPTGTGYRRLAEIYASTGRPDELLDILGNVIEATGLLEILGSQAEDISGNAELMKSLIDTARSRQQSQPEQLTYHASYAVAMLALLAQQYETAAEFFDLAIQIEPAETAEVLLVWGLELLYADHPAEAAEVFRRAVDDPALSEDAAQFHYFLARAFRSNDQDEEALAAARKAVEQEDDVPLFRGQVGWILYGARRYDEAIEVFRELIEEFDSYRDSSEIRDVLREARLAISSLYVIREDTAEAEEWLQQVLDEFPDDAGASNDLGYLWADQGIHLDRALKMIQHAVEVEPDNAAYIDSLGWVFYRLGRYDEALVELEKAVAAEDEPDPVILDHLGDAQLKVDQPEQARQAWRRAVEAFTERDEPQKARQVQEKIDANEQETED